MVAHREVRRADSPGARGGRVGALLHCGSLAERGRERGIPSGRRVCGVWRQKNKERRMATFVAAASCARIAWTAALPPAPALCRLVRRYLSLRQPLGFALAASELLRRAKPRNCSQRTKRMRRSAGERGSRQRETSRFLATRIPPHALELPCRLSMRLRGSCRSSPHANAGGREPVPSPQQLSLRMFQTRRGQITGPPPRPR